jgi:hypothetical protein
MRSEVTILYVYLSTPPPLQQLLTQLLHFYEIR